MYIHQRPFDGPLFSFFFSSLVPVCLATCAMYLILEPKDSSLAVSVKEEEEEEKKKFLPSLRLSLSFESSWQTSSSRDDGTLLACSIRTHRQTYTAARIDPPTRRQRHSAGLPGRPGRFCIETRLTRDL